MKFNKKAISPVVATALLLVVAVVAVVGFQTWFTTYQSGQLVKVEQESDGGVALSIERLEAGGTVYIKNTGDTAINVTTLTVTSTDGECAYNYGDAAANAVTTYTNTSNTCDLTSGEVADVVAQTANGIVAVEMLAR